MPGVVQIILNAVDNASGAINKTDTSARNLAAGVLSAVGPYVSLSAAVGGSIAFIKSADEETLNYASDVRALSQASGESTEDTSRFIQVLDDYKISAEDALAATRFLTKNGYEPNIQSLGELSDKYISLNTVEERNKLLYDNLGRSSLKWQEVLSKGSKSLNEQGDAVAANLILSQKAVDAARENEIAVDDWNDALMGLKLTLGGEVLPALTASINSTMDNARAMDIARDAGATYHTAGTLVYRGAVEQAIAEREAATATKLASEAMRDSADSADANAKALDALAQANANILKGAMDTAAANADYKEKQDDILKTMQDLRAEKEKLYPWETDKLNDVNDKLRDQWIEYDKNEQKFKEAMTEKFALMTIEAIEMEDGAKGFSDAELTKAEAVLNTLGVTQQADIEQQLAQQALLTALENNEITVGEYGAIWKQVSADAVVDVNEVTKAIDNIPDKKNVVINIKVKGNVEYAKDVGAIAKVTGFASGGSFTVPSIYGYEGFNLGGMGTASAGERVTVSPDKGNDNSALAEVLSRMPTERGIAKALAVELQKIYG